MSYFINLLFSSIESGNTAEINSLLAHDIFGTKDIIKSLRLSCPEELSTTLYHKIWSFLHVPFVNINVRDFKTNTPLLYAAQKSQTEIVNLFLTIPHIDVNLQTPEEWTALHYAVCKENLNMVESLAQHSKINLNIRDESGRTPLLIALEKQNISMMKILIKNKANPNLFHPSSKINVLSWACKKSNVEFISFLLNNFPDDQLNVNCINEFGNSPLLDMARDGNIKVLEMLLEHENIDVHLESVIPKTNKKTNAFLEACSRGHIDIVKLLLDHNVDPNRCSNYRNALMRAGVVGHTNVVKLLLSLKNIQINRRNLEGQTAFTLAQRYQKFNIVRLLLNHPDCDISIKRKKWSVDVGSNFIELSSDVFANLKKITCSSKKLYPL